VTSLLVIGNQLISAGRDSVILIWNLDKNEQNDQNPETTLAAYEPLEALQGIDNPHDKYQHILLEINGVIYSVGQRGSVRGWSVDEGKEIKSEKSRRNVTPKQPDLESGHNLLKNIDNELVCIDNNHNVHFITGTAYYCPNQTKNSKN